MNLFQKVIKYLTFAFAMFLSISIIVGIITGLVGVSYILSGRDNEAVGEMQVYPIEEEISSLSLSLSEAKLKIKTAEKFSVESNHNYISVKADNGKLTIGETKKFFATSPKGATVILSIPKDFVFDDAMINTGAGKVEIETLSCDVLELFLGAGKADIKNLTANSRADIEGGAGELKIDGGRICNLGLDMGVGELTLKSRIEGQSRLDYGIGETKLTLLGSREDYQIEIDKGIGEAKLQGESMSDDSVYGTGENRIEIDGGIGAINIEFSEDGTQKAF
ncbi:MAG: DUF4097 family beta strand repeat-containing protein [Oscillospiraceae bacterium]